MRVLMLLVPILDTYKNSNIEMRITVPYKQALYTTIKIQSAKHVFKIKPAMVFKLFVLLGS